MSVFHRIFPVGFMTCISRGCCSRAGCVLLVCITLERCCAQDLSRPLTSSAVPLSRLHWCFQFRRCLLEQGQEHVRKVMQQGPIQQGSLICHKTVQTSRESMAACPVLKTLACDSVTLTCNGHGALSTAMKVGGKRAGSKGGAQKLTIQGSDIRPNQPTLLLVMKGQQEGRSPCPRFMHCAV